ncbi:hypothetical protein [Streptomyces sp. NPDC046805]|uniref:hypothetical protein n=1 Tax=Streptomyces sp. NPDC046805 TaxID=3155134 RepID=UPI0033E99427
MKTLVHWARAEWGPLYVAVRERLLERRWSDLLAERSALTTWRAWARAAPMTLGAVCLTAGLQFVQNQPWGFRLVEDAGAVRAADPLVPSLLRTPLSLFVPALDLPVWGALAQVLFVIGLAEICLGPRRTLAIGYAATLAGTLYARIGVALGPGQPLGLPPADAQVVDTGPSAAVVALAVYLGWRYGARITAGAVVTAMTAEVLLKENLAGKEHLAALTGVGMLCGASALRERYRSGHPRPGRRPVPESGLPPIQS